MNILFITGIFPYPLNNGRNIRAYNLIKKLSEKNELTLVITEGKKQDLESLNEMKKFCKDIRIIPFIPLSKPKLFLRLFFGLFRKEPLSLLKRYSNKVQEEVDLLLKNNKIDAVICDRLTETLYILKRQIRAFKVYSTHNIEYLIVQRFSELTTNIFKKMASLLEYKRTMRYERNVWRSFNFAIAVSETDKNIMSKFMHPQHVFVIPNGIDTEYFKSKSNDSVPFSIIYTGQMGWYPNEDAVVYFKDKIYPLIKKEIPTLKFYIVGSNTSDKVKKLGVGDSNIEITGRVDDIRTCIEKAAVCVVPLRIGSGTRIKILEALSMQKPVVSTHIGCEGLDVTDEENILIADEPNKFADKLITLLKDGVMRQRLGSAGRMFVKQKYDWSIVFDDLEKFNTKLGISAGGRR